MPAPFVHFLKPVLEQLEESADERRDAAPDRVPSKEVSGVIDHDQEG